MHIARVAWRKVTKVTNPISDFTFLSTAKFGKSRIKNPFLDSPKGTHPNLARSHERICRPGKSNFSQVTGGLITATISVNVGKALMHSSDFTE